MSVVLCFFFFFKLRERFLLLAQLFVLFVDLGAYSLRSNVALMMYLPSHNFLTIFLWSLSEWCSSVQWAWWLVFHCSREVICLSLDLILFVFLIFGTVDEKLFDIMIGFYFGLPIEWVMYMWLLLDRRKSACSGLPKNVIWAVFLIIELLRAIVRSYWCWCTWCSYSFFGLLKRGCTE